MGATLGQPDLPGLRKRGILALDQRRTAEEVDIRGSVRQIQVRSINCHEPPPR